MLRDGIRPDSRQEVNIQGSNNKEFVLETDDVSYLPCLVCCIDILAEKFSFNSSPLFDHSKRVLGFVVRKLRHSGLRFRTTKTKTPSWSYVISRKSARECIHILTEVLEIKIDIRKLQSTSRTLCKFRSA